MIRSDDRTVGPTVRGVRHSRTQFLEGLLASTRYGKNQAERALSLMAAYSRQDVLAALERAVQYGAFSLAADATYPGGTEPAQNAARSLGRRLSQLPGGVSQAVNRHRRDPPPIINPVGQGSHDAEASESPEPGDIEDGKPPIKAMIPHLLHNDVTAALEPWVWCWLPAHWTRHCPRRRKNH